MKKINLLSVLFLTACVTINVYFPAGETEAIADEIIEEVQGLKTSKKSGDFIGRGGFLRVSQSDPVTKVLSFFISSAEAGVNISVNSSEIRQLKSSMKARFTKLQPYYESGTIGITSKGLIAVRKSPSLKDRNKVNRMVKNENSDRNKLYKAIANSNGHPEWLNQIKSTFAKKWISHAQPGWDIQLGNGQWSKK